MTLHEVSLYWADPIEQPEDCVATARLTIANDDEYTVTKFTKKDVKDSRPIDAQQHDISAFSTEDLIEELGRRLMLAAVKKL